MRIKNSSILVTLLIVLLVAVNCGNGGGNNSGQDVPPANSTLLTDHTAIASFDSIPAETITAVQTLNIAYWHTSHGSQLVSGINYLSATYALPNLQNLGSPDLGTATWNEITATYLDTHPETDVVIWSWCGQVSTNIDMESHYLSKMAVLEAAYPEVTFIYMTGHLRGAYNEYLYNDTTNQRLQTNNNEIRTFCSKHNKWLFDFADIESYLDNSTEQCMYNSMPVECLWPTEPTGSCAHSRAPNCVRKGKAFWWILARISGWVPTS